MLTCAAVHAQLARLRVQLQQQGIALPEGPRVSMDMHSGDKNPINTSGELAVSLPVSHISPRCVLLLRAIPLPSLFTTSRMVVSVLGL